MQTKYRIVHLISGLQRGGAETMLVDLIDQLGTEKYEHHVIYFHAGPYVDQLHKQGHALYQIRGAVCLYDPLFLVRLMLCIRKIQPKVIHSHLWAANLLARLIGNCIGIPVMCTLHSPFTPSDGIVRKWLDYYSLSQARYLCAVSDSVKDSWKAEFALSDAHLITVSNGINLYRFSACRSDLLQHQGIYSIPKDAYIVGSVGRFIVSKRFDVLIEAYALTRASHPEAHLILVGGGPQEYRLRLLVEQYGLQQHVTFIIGQSAQEWYQAMDCFVMASEREGLSIALLEAMAAQCPVVVGSPVLRHDVIEHGVNGLLAVGGIPQAIANAIVECIEYKDLALLRGIQARSTVETKFSSVAMAKSYEKIYSAIM